MRSGNFGGGMTTGMLLGSAVVLLALPSAVLALATGFDSAPTRRPATGSSLDSAQGAGLVPTTVLRSLARGPLYPFTPAGTPNRPERSVTVAVRVDPATAREISVRGERLSQVETAKPAAPLRIASSAFNLGVSRGYSSFAQGLVPMSESKEPSDFSSAIGKPETSLRVVPRVGIEDGRAAGRAPRTFAGDGGKKLDLGGSYRVTGNLNVTTGVRLSQERERLRPLADGDSDNQAVYVGTQFRF